MPSASAYDRLITLQRAEQEQGAYGVRHVWSDVRSFQGGCEYFTQIWNDTEQQAGEVDATWVIRSRSDILSQAREVGRHRFVCRIRGQTSVFYPKSLPVYKQGEWRVDCSDEEDIDQLETVPGQGPY